MAVRGFPEGFKFMTSDPRWLVRLAARLWWLMFVVPVAMAIVGRISCRVN